MSERPTEELPPLPEDFSIEPPERRSEPRTRSVRRPAKGRRTSGPQKPARSRQKQRSPDSIPGPAETVRGILQIPATASVIVGQRTGSVPLIADGATVLVHGPVVADAIEEWAKVDPRVAVILEKLVMFGPATAVAMALVVMGAQLYRNHNEEAGAIMAGFGAVPAHEIIATAGLQIPVDISGNGSRDGSPPEN